uniref:Cilia and flagella associated protein 107 n=1 Tax=Anser brachyrhynchus TaxID=132585 RepID=A0A8B9CT43_9AVES
MIASIKDGRDWWKIEPKYSTKVLIGNWLEERKRGLPAQHFFTHHEEPRSRNLVSEYEDKYNRHSYDPALPPLRGWNGRKLAWIPQKPDFPILEPPTNYGLLEHLMKKWHKKEAGMMRSVYTISYEKPPISAFAKIHGLSSRSSLPRHYLQTMPSMCFLL